jgi:glycyl-tRNA synthetase beta subunit
VTRDAAGPDRQRRVIASAPPTRFFFTEDQKDLDGLRAKLDDVVFQAKLGAARPPATGRRIEAS